jgi:hypothetical protein
LELAAYFDTAEALFAITITEDIVGDKLHN